MPHYESGHSRISTDPKGRSVDLDTSPPVKKPRDRTAKHPSCMCGHRWAIHDEFGCPRCDDCLDYHSHKDPRPRCKYTPLEAKIVQVGRMLMKKNFYVFSNYDGVVTCGECWETIRVGSMPKVNSDVIMLRAHEHREKHCPTGQLLDPPERRTPRV